jgi:hypothetical protein
MKSLFSKSSASRSKRPETGPCSDRELTRLLRMAYANPPAPGRVPEVDAAVEEPRRVHGRR